MKNFNGLGFYALVGFAILGVTLTVIDAYDPNGLHLIYADNTETIRGENFDEVRQYLGDSYHAVWTSTPDRMLDNNEYVDFKTWQDSNKIYFESKHTTQIFDIDTCTLEGYDGGKIGNKTPQTKLSHTLKTALNGTDIWNVDSINETSCTVTQTPNEKGIQIISSKGDFKTIYDINYASGVEWTYQYTNNDETKTDQKYGFTSVCDGVSCGDVTIDDIIINDGETKTKEEIINKKIKVGNKSLDLKEKQHGYTWAMKKVNDSKMILDFTHSKGRLNVGDTLIVDPTFSQATSDDGRVWGTSGSGSACHATYGSGDSSAFIDTSNTGTGCTGAYFNFDVSSISDGASVTSASIEYDIIYTKPNTKNCDWKHMDFSAGLDQTTYEALTADVGSVVDIKQNSSVCTGSVADGYTVSFDTGGYATLFESDITGDDEISIGGFFTDQSRGAEQQFDFRNDDMILEIEYDVGVYNPGPPINPSGTGLPYANNFTFNMNNATAVQGSAIWNSTDNITFTWLDNVSNGTEFYLHGDLGVNEEQYYKVSHYSFNNGTNSTAISLTTDNYPDAPTISASADSETQITISYDSAGASDGGDTVKDYNLQASINSGPWLDLVSNSTHVSSYPHTGLTSGDVVIYGWRDGNGVGWSSSANTTATSYEDIVASLTIDTGNVGDVINATGTLTVTSSSPLPVTITSMELIRNGSSVQTVNPGNSLNIETEVLDTPVWYPITNDNSYEYTLNATITNGNDSIEITSSNSEIVIREYNPVYIPAEVLSEGNLNYTITRNDNDMTLKMNRDLGGTWQAECIHRNLSEALAGEGGTWNNQTVVGYYQDDRSTANTETIYIACYNDNLLFNTVSYSNSTNSLVLGLSIFDDLGGLFGAPAVLLIILAIATMATGRTAPTILVILLTVIGIVGALGMLVLEAEVWGLLVVAGAIGIFQIRRLF